MKPISDSFARLAIERGELRQLMQDAIAAKEKEDMAKAAEKNITPVAIQEAALVVAPQNSMAAMSGEQVSLRKRTVCKDASNDERQLVVNVCNSTDLDLFTKDIYQFQRSDK